MGTHRIESNYIGLGDGNGGINLNAYLRYLKNRGFIEDVQKQEQAMIDRARELGVNANPSAIAFREGYNLSRYGNVNGKQDNTSSEAYNQLLIEYKALKLSYDKLAKKYNQLLNQRNSNRISSNSSANRQSTAYSNTSKSSSNYIKPGISFTHLKQPKLFGAEWGRYTSGATNIEFIDDKLYNNYYRKVRIKGNIGYINMNTFK